MANEGVEIRLHASDGTYKRSITLPESAATRFITFDGVTYEKQETDNGTIWQAPAESAE
jgi:hypothetical protein